MKAGKSILKIGVAVFYLLAVNTGFTRAFYSDSATSVSNTFGASSLDFVLKNTDDTDVTTEILTGVDMRPGDSVSGALKVVKTGELDFEYNVSGEHKTGSLALYNALNVTISVDGTALYTGSLSSAALVPPVAITGGEDIIDITVYLPVSVDPSLQLQSTSFDFVVKGDQLGPVMGFWDEERASGSVSTTDWTPPVISNIMIASPADVNGLKISWNTDEVSTAYVELGTDMTYSTGDFYSAGNTAHISDLTGAISLNTDYHFRIVATDGYGNTTITDDYEFNVDWEWIEFITRSNIVINEYLPDPIGLDDELRPGGEWVELYNKGGSSVDVNGWLVCSAGQCISINSARTNTGSTLILPGGFLVVYFENIYSGGILNNSGLDVVSLYDHVWYGYRLRDMHWFYGSQEGKSNVRYPDGSRNWYDPTPTPGAPNTLEPIEPELPEETDIQEVNSETETDVEVIE